MSDEGARLSGVPSGNLRPDAEPTLKAGFRPRPVVRDAKGAGPRPTKPPATPASATKAR